MKLLFKLLRLRMSLLPIGTRAKVTGVRFGFCYYGTGSVGTIAKHVFIVGNNDVRAYYRFDEHYEELVPAQLVERDEECPRSPVEEALKQTKVV